MRQAYESRSRGRRARTPALRLHLLRRRSAARPRSPQVGGRSAEASGKVGLCKANPLLRAHAPIRQEDEMSTEEDGMRAQTGPGSRSRRPGVRSPGRNEEDWTLRARGEEDRQERRQFAEPGGEAFRPLKDPGRIPTAPPVVYVVPLRYRSHGRRLRSRARGRSGHEDGRDGWERKKSPPGSASCRTWCGNACDWGRFPRN